MLDEAIAFLERKNCTYEIIVVSDGSKDETVSVAQKYAELHGTNKVRVLKLIENRGKGGAVRLVSNNCNFSGVQVAEDQRGIYVVAQNPL